MTRVKICGIRSIDEARAVIDADADALGFHVDLEHSKCPIGAATVSAIISRLPPFVASVVVTTTTDAKDLIRLVKATWPTTLQLHGEVSSDTVRAVKAVLPFLKIYAVVHVSGSAVAEGSGETKEDAVEKVRAFEDAADAVILDTAGGSARGGTGKVHDWRISKKIVESVSIPIILAGGLNPENAADAVRQVRSYAVDVESGVSNADHTKNIEKVKLFIERAKSV